MRTLWLQTDSALNGGQFLIDFDTRKAPVIAEGNPLRIELGAFTSGLPADLGDYTSLNLSIYASRFDIDGAPLVTEGLPAEDITDTITTSAWNSRLASNATFEISGATLSFDLGSDTSKKLFMVVSALTSETETVLGASEITVFADQNPRRAGLGFQSDWLTATTYLKGDLVKRSDTVYIALIKHTSGTSSAPGTGADWGDYWEIFVERGAPGTDGTNGTNGTNGTDGVGFTYRGTWVDSTTYAVGDVIVVFGAAINAYVCIQAHTADTLSQPESGGSWTSYWGEDPVNQSPLVPGFTYNTTLPSAAANMTVFIRITNSASDPSGNTPGFNNAPAFSDGSKWRYVTNGLTVNGA